MGEKLETKKYVFTVEGETEKWYLVWLQDLINTRDDRLYNVILKADVQQSPKRYYKKVTAKAAPLVYHLCDVESTESVYEEKFQNILSEMKAAKKEKGIKYELGYSNFTFELWIILHKQNCNGCLTHRSQYLTFINRAFGECFEDLDHYKKEKNFKRCLDKITFEDVLQAIERADTIEATNLENDKTLIRYKTYSYYKDNPSLSIHSVVKKIFENCGLIEKKGADSSCKE